jgi:hypothetical protein
MAATLEIKYYNSFWLKKIQQIVNVGSVPLTGVQVTSQQDNTNGTATIGVDQAVLNANAAVGSEIIINYSYGAIPNNTDYQFKGYITQKNSTTSLVINGQPNPSVIGSTTQEVIFGSLVNFNSIPQSYAQNNERDWFIEEARIQGGYNNTSVDFGVKAYAVDENKAGEVRNNALIYSGIYNSRTGVNNTNQFPIGQEITKAVDPSYGSIQRLYAEDTNLIVFQEDKVSRALIDKDAIYSAEGGGTVTTSNLVIGTIQPYGGEYGISTEPESFAVYGYRKYFSDRKRNAVLRLSLDGIEEISRYGMTDFFRDELSKLTTDSKIIGGYDLHTKKYDLSILPSGQFSDETPADQVGSYKTLAFDESVKGWTSFYTYAPDFIGSLKNKFYSFKQGAIWEHYNDSNSYATFYNNAEDANVKFIFNVGVSAVKNYKTVNYEGSGGWTVSELSTNVDTGNPIDYYLPSTSPAALENQLFATRFIRKEDKYFANIINTSVQTTGEIPFGASMTGIKGFFATVEMSLSALNNKAQFPAELFAVSTEYVESSY